MSGQLVIHSSRAQRPKDESGVSREEEGLRRSLPAAATVARLLRAAAKVALLLLLGLLLLGLLLGPTVEALLRVLLQQQRQLE
jgi:hypothetical protein